MKNYKNKFILEMQAFEFYMFETIDLFDQSNQILLLDAGTEYGATRKRINQFSDISSLLTLVSNNRTSLGTKMNVNNKNHSGSSRSHCALVLTLH